MSLISPLKTRQKGAIKNKPLTDSEAKDEDKEIKEEKVLL